MLPARRHPLLAIAAAAALALLASGCAPDPVDSEPRATPAPASSAGASASTTTPTPTPTPSATAVSLPTDCRAILTQNVLDELGDVPLNAPETGIPTGVQGESLVCLWRDPGADTTYLQTTISWLNRGPALDLLNELADTEDFTCYTPDGGTRCENSWINDEYPVMDGRTLFWRDDVLIDTQYSNLAPAGYTDAIIASLWG